MVVLFYFGLRFLRDVNCFCILGVSAYLWAQINNEGISFFRVAEFGPIFILVWRLVSMLWGNNMLCDGCLCMGYLCESTLFFKEL